MLSVPHLMTTGRAEPTSAWPVVITSAITCGEWGTSEARRWSEPIRLVSQDREGLRLYEQHRVLQVRAVPAPGMPDWSDAPLFAGVPRDEWLQVAGTDSVGVLTLPSGRRISIRPKVGGLTLLDWLAYLGESPPVTGWLRESLHQTCEGGSLEPAVAALLVAELETLTRRHFRKQYVPRRTESATVRGKVLTSALARRFHRLPALPQTSPARTWDTPPHALLAAALDRVTLLLGADLPPLQSQLASLADAWSAVRRPDPADLPRLIEDCRIAPPLGYGPALQLAVLVLQGCSPQRQKMSRPPPSVCPSFLVSVARIWERALRRMCRELTAETGWAPAADSQRTRRWHDGADPASVQTASATSARPDPPRWMTADALLESAGRRWVLDAKYKLGYGDEDRNDRFQAAAYAVAFDAGRGSLVYPTADGDTGRRRLLLAGEVAGRRVMIDSLELPMSAGPQACREAFGKLIQSVPAE